MVKDSGQREQFATGSVRDTRKGKGRFDLIPPLAIMRIAKHYEAGAEKYGDRNWEKGQPISRFYDSGMRHLMRYWAGEPDEDHLSAAIWNFMAIMHFEELHDNDYTVPTGVMDRPWDRKESDGLEVETHQTPHSNRRDAVGSGDGGDDRLTVSGKSERGCDAVFVGGPTSPIHGVIVAHSRIEKGA